MYSTGLLPISALRFFGQEGSLSFATEFAVPHYSLSLQLADKR